jgi:1-pyrroline-5-carboxylate dehydrogenase
VVGQQPFGGARGSGTNDKAGSKSEPAAVGERAHREGKLRSPTAYRYPYMSEE